MSAKLKQIRKKIEAIQIRLQFLKKQAQKLSTAKNL